MASREHKARLKAGVLADLEVAIASSGWPAPLPDRVRALLEEAAATLARRYPELAAAKTRWLAGPDEPDKL